MTEQKNSRFPWFMLIFGLVIGLAGGLAYAWFVNPVEWVDIAPERLSAEEQREYILLIAEAYLQDQDFNRAQARLAALGLKDTQDTIAVYADAAYLRGAPAGEIRALTTLAEALGANPLAADVFSGTIAPTTVSLVETPTATFEGVPTLTLTATEEPPIPTATELPPSPTSELVREAELLLLEREVLCETTEPVGMLEVYVYNRFEQGIPSVEIFVEWEEGEDRFFTGLKPSIDTGYADFEMIADQIYAVTLVGLSEPVVGLSSEGCIAENGRLSIPSYRLIFGPSGGF